LSRRQFYCQTFHFFKLGDSEVRPPAQEPIATLSWSQVSGVVSEKWMDINSKGPEGRQRVAQGVSPGVACPQENKTIYLSVFSQGLRPGLLSVGPPGLLSIHFLDTTLELECYGHMAPLCH